MMGIWFGCQGLFFSHGFHVKFLVLSVVRRTVEKVEQSVQYYIVQVKGDAW